MTASDQNALVRDIPLMFTGLTDLCEEEPGYLLGMVAISGVKHHVEFVRVDESDSGLTVWKSGEPDITENNNYRLAKILKYCGDTPKTVEVSGFEGRYVCIITPYSKG